LFQVFDRLRRAPDAEPLLDPTRERAAPGIARLERGRESGPHILFPPNAAEIIVTERGVALSAQGREPLTWYAEGAPIPREDSSGRVVWRPREDGFYDVTVVDAEGRRSSAHVRVRREES
jgi:penicillin-binding protein 1C